MHQEHHHRQNVVEALQVAKLSDFMLGVWISGLHGDPALDVLRNHLSGIFGVRCLSHPVELESGIFCQRNSVADTTKAMSPVGMKYNSRP